MSYARVTIGLLILMCILFVHCAVLKHNPCDDIGHRFCTVSRVDLKPCKEDGDFCKIKRNKKYTLNVNFMPYFSAKNLNLSMYGDDSNKRVFSTAVDNVPSDACRVLKCPLQRFTKLQFEIDFVLGEKFAEGKFPMQVMLFNKKYEKPGCCFYFDIQFIN